MTAVTKEHFEYLDELRKSGAINMFGAPPHLAREFHLPKAEAIKIWGLWADTFDETKPVDQRVAEANGD